MKLGASIQDLIVDDVVIADPKVVIDFNETHVAQLIGYVSITRLPVATILNFKHVELRGKRLIR